MTTEYYVNQGGVPLEVAVFACTCGAKLVECELHPGSAPDGWAIAADGTTLCPHCASPEESEKAEF